MKKMSLLAAAALMSTFLVACEGKKEKPAEETKAPEVTEQTQKPAEQPVKEEAPKVEEKAETPKPKETKAPEVTEEVQKPTEEEKTTIKEEAEKQVAAVTEQAKEKVEETVEKAKEKVVEEQPIEETKEAPQVVETKPPVQQIDGRRLFSSKGCTVCHKEKLDTVGPSLAKISTKYNGDKDRLIKFLRGKHPAIVDPARYTMMKPQISITKQMSEAELSALADYILSIK